MGGPVASADAASASRSSEYHFEGASTPDCTICGENEALFFIGQEDCFQADADVGLSVADQMLTTEEVFVPHDLDALVTKAGLIDALSVLHPTWAGVLYCLCCDGGDLGQGYTFNFVENPQEILDLMNARLANVDRQALDERIDTLRWMLPQYEQIEEQYSDGGMLHPPAQVYEQRRLDPNLTSGDIMYELRGLVQLRNGLDQGYQFTHDGTWFIDTDHKVIRASAWINDDLDDPIPDGFVNRNVTNRQAADWLAGHLSRTFGDGEFFWDFILRYTTGTVLLALGAVEMFVGATAAAAAGWTGIGAVGGAALTVTGWNAFEAGARMWMSADSTRHTTLLDQAINRLGVAAFGSDRAYIADRGWALAQILIGVGAGVAIARGSQGALRGPALSNGTPSSGRFAALTIENIQMAVGRGVRATRLPSLRGVHLEIPGIGKVLAKASDADVRWLLHILMTPVARLRELVQSAARRTGRSANPPVGPRLTRNGYEGPYNQAQLDAAEQYGIEPRWVQPDGTPYPPNDGFAGTPTEVTLEPGTRFDRFGGRYQDGQFVDGGRFVAPSDVPLENRAMMPGDDPGFRNEYVVLRPIPGVRAGEIAPWYGTPGGGTQYQMPRGFGIDELIAGDYIERITTP